MLKANVGLSRKISRDYNSTGYTVNLEGEIPAPVDDAQGVLAKVRELFSLAQEALSIEIDRDQGEHAIGRRDEERPAEANGHQGRTADESNGTPSDQQSARPNNRSNQEQVEAATNKQIQFLLTMGKRFKLSQPQLEGKIADIIGRRCGIYQLTKKEAGQVLNQFTQASNGNGQRK
jgi:hypothetical protein